MIVTTISWILVMMNLPWLTVEGHSSKKLKDAYVSGERQLLKEESYINQVEGRRLARGKLAAGKGRQGGLARGKIAAGKGREGGSLTRQASRR